MSEPAKNITKDDISKPMLWITSAELSNAYIMHATPQLSWTCFRGNAHDYAHDYGHDYILPHVRGHGHDRDYEYVEI